MSALRVEPGLDAFLALARRWPMVPMWTELTADVCTPVGLFPALRGGGPGALLESVERSERWGRFSFVAGSPAALVTVDGDGAHIERQARELPLPVPAGGSPLEQLRRVVLALRAPRMPALPPLAGGLVGLLAYEAATLLDGSPSVPGVAPCPPMAFMVLDRAVVFDHWRQRLFLVVHVPGGRGGEGWASGREALDALARTVAAARPPAPEPVGLRPPPAADAGLVPYAEVSTLDPEAVARAVEAIREHIFAGDIFQAVLSRRVSVPAPSGALPIYRRLRLANPAPYMFLLDLPGLELAGSSPEPLVRVQGRHVLGRPIAGTRPRGAGPEEDRRLEEELVADPKERAEHAMLVDLARNDLGKVCAAGSVRVTELMRVERFSNVMHLVSTVEGDLREGADALDALAAAFPAGTVTGAPKRRAMEIIARHEPTARGPYAGAVGYVTFAGDLDFCLTIRTVVVSDGTAGIQSGAGIVADSDPARELAEMRAKASALLAAVRQDDPEGVQAGEGVPEGVAAGGGPA